MREDLLRSDYGKYIIEVWVEVLRRLQIYKHRYTRYSATHTSSIVSSVRYFCNK